MTKEQFDSRLKKMLTKAAVFMYTTHGMDLEDFNRYFENKTIDKQVQFLMGLASENPKLFAEFKK